MLHSFLSLSQRLSHRSRRLCCTVALQLVLHFLACVCMRRASEAAAGIEPVMPVAS